MPGKKEDYRDTTTKALSSSRDVASKSGSRVEILELTMVA